MGTIYRNVLEQIRMAFPQPVSDRVHDSSFVHSIMRAVEAVDAMKRSVPFLVSVVNWIVTPPGAAG